jgi:BASS family bile acid:Na+ symporter
MRMRWFLLTCSLLSRQLAPLTLLGAIAAYVYPPAFLVFRSSFLWLFAATMLALGVVLDVDELYRTLRQPGRVGLGVLTQFVVMPTLGFAVAMLAPLPDAVRLGFIIVACAPGAMASNVIVYLAGGRVAYSVAMTTVATFLSPVVTPLLVKWLGGAILHIEFWPMLETIVLTVVLPLWLGILLQRFLRTRRALTEILAPAVAAMAIVIICSYAVAVNQARLAAVGGWVIAMVILLNALGYLAGWMLGRLYGFDASYRFTLAVEIGMQNAGLGVALALQHFAPETALPGALFAVWCILTAAGASAWLQRQRALESGSN